MTILSSYRPATFDEVVAEMDRRGEVIGKLESRLLELEESYFLPGRDRRLVWLSALLAKQGYFNRKHIIGAFNVSEPQASDDIQRWMLLNQGAATYSQSRKRYEATGRVAA